MKIVDLPVRCGACGGEGPLILNNGCGVPMWAVLETTGPRIGVLSLVCSKCDGIVTKLIVTGMVERPDDAKPN